MNQKSNFVLTIDLQIRIRGFDLKANMLALLEWLLPLAVASIRLLSQLNGATPSTG